MVRSFCLVPRPPWNWPLDPQSWFSAGDWLSHEPPRQLSVWRSQCVWVTAGGLLRCFWDQFFFFRCFFWIEPYFCWKKSQFALVCWFLGWIFLQFLPLTSRCPSMKRFVPGSSGLSSWDMVAWIAGVGGLKRGKTSSQLIEGIFRSLSSSDFYFNYRFFFEMSFFGERFVVFQDWVLKSQTSFLWRVEVDVEIYKTPGMRKYPLPGRSFSGVVSWGWCSMLIAFAYPVPTFDEAWVRCLGVTNPQLVRMQDAQSMCLM